jgi:hypothetical protein
VIDRWIPFVPAAYGTRVAQPARTMWLAHVGEGSPLAGPVRLVPVTTVSLASCEAARQPVAGCDHGRSSRLLPSVGSRNDDPGPIIRAQGRPAPRAHLPSAVRQALIGIPSPTREDAVNSALRPTIISFYPRTINRDKMVFISAEAYASIGGDSVRGC